MILRLAACAAVTFATSAFAFDYIADDGSGSINSGPSFDAVDFLWGNTFTAAPGAEVITTIQVAFGSAIDGAPVEVLLFDDPTDDADPADAVLLATATGTVSQPRTNMFIDFAIAPTAVSGDFFVAALMRNINGSFAAVDRQAPARRDPQTVTGAGWAFSDATGSLDVASLGASAIVWHVGSPSFPAPANNMVRAVGVAPEPAGLAVPAAGATALTRRRRRR